MSGGGCSVQCEFKGKADLPSQFLRFFATSQNHRTGKATKPGCNEPENFSPYFPLTNPLQPLIIMTNQKVIFKISVIALFTKNRMRLQFEYLGEEFVWYALMLMFEDS